MNFKDWEWNNGKYYKYDKDFNTIIISLFASFEANKEFGHLIIKEQIVMTGVKLGATNREEGSLLLLKYYTENYDQLLKSHESNKNYFKPWDNKE